MKALFCCLIHVLIELLNFVRHSLAKTLALATLHSTEETHYKLI